MEHGHGFDPTANRPQRDLVEGGPLLSPSQATVFRRLAVGDELLLAPLLGRLSGSPDPLDETTACLVRVAALVICDAPVSAYQAEVRHALDLGVSITEISAVLMTVAPIAGSALVMSAAPKLAISLGYDVDAALEAPDPGAGG